MKRRDVIISVIALLFFVFLFFENSLANIAWAEYRNARAAVFLTRDAKLAMSIGNFYFNGGAYDLDIAQKAFSRAVKIDPKILWGHYQLARIYFVKGEKDKALREINKELEANPENLRSLYVRGLIYGYSGKLAEAEADFRRFTLWAPMEWAGYNDLAWILAKEGKYEDDLAALNNAFKKVPEAEKNAWLKNSLGVAYLNLKEYKKAEKALLSAKKLAENLTLDEWEKAYPGNSPNEAATGLESFKAALEANLFKSRVENSL